MREINKKPFSVGLYIEGLRQLRIVGILGAILLFCSSAITVVGNALSTQRQMELYQDSSIVLANLSALEVAPLLLLLFSVFAPVMTLWLFHFMNKRNSSDFLFAIPQTRMALYCSYTSSIVTWLAILALSGLIGVLIPAAIFSTYINIPYHALFLLTLSCFLYSLQVMAAILVAMSITGTMFSNIILSGLILFAPRLLIFMLTGIWKKYSFYLCFVRSLFTSKRFHQPHQWLCVISIMRHLRYLPAILFCCPHDLQCMPECHLSASGSVSLSKTKK